jgi:hypothetical protein
MCPIIDAALNARRFMYIVRGKFHVFSFSGIKNVLNSLDLRRILRYVNKNTPLPASFTGALHEYFVKQFIKEHNPSGISHENNFHGTRQSICMERQFDIWVTMQRSFAKIAIAGNFLAILETDR